MWSRKYRPGSLQDYRGSSKEKKKLVDLVKGWGSDSKPIMIHGQAGTGKTSLVEALAADLDRELVETNASDVRTKKKMKQELLESVRQKSLLDRRKIILIDEVDGMSGRSDRGGSKVLSEILDETSFPVIMTANDAYDSSLRTFRNRSELVEIDSVHTNSIAAHLRDILEQEGIEYEDGVTKRIARQADGQMRSAVNDLESVARGREKVSLSDLESAARRDERKEVFDSLKIVLKTTNPSNAKSATDNLDESPDDWLQWIRENVPREYSDPQDLKRAYSQVSKADLFNGRIRKTMEWSLMRYVYLHSTIGVALSKQSKYDGWTKYQYPSKIKKMGQNRSSRKMLEEIGEKLSDQLHISVSQSKTEIRFLARLLEESDDQQMLGLTDDQIQFIKEF